MRLLFTMALAGLVVQIALTHVKIRRLAPNSSDLMQVLMNNSPYLALVCCAVVNTLMNALILPGYLGYATWVTVQRSFPSSLESRW